MGEEEQKKVINDAQKFSADVEDEKSKLKICINQFTAKTQRMAEEEKKKFLDSLEKFSECKLVLGLIQMVSKK